MAGLLGDDYDDPKTQGILSFALNMLANSGPSPMPRSFGQIVGASGTAGMEQYSKRKKERLLEEESRRRASLTDAQINEYKEKASWRMAKLKNGEDPDAPSSVREWQYFSQLPPESQSRYLEMKRTAPSFMGMPLTREPGGQYAPNVNVPAFMGLASEMNRNKAFGTGTGEAQTRFTPVTGPDNKPSYALNFDILRQLNPERFPNFDPTKQAGNTTIPHERFPRVSPEEQAARDVERNKVLAQEGLPPLAPGGPPGFRPPAAGEPEARRQTLLAEARAKAQNDLPRVMANGNEMIKTLKTAIDHPGMTSYVGASALIPDSLVIPGTNQAAFQGIFQKIQGKSFLQAYEALKGGGQITEVEGEKATAAISALQNRKLSTEDWKKEAQTLIDIVDLAMKRQSAMSRGVPFITSDEEYMALPSGSSFIDPKGNERRKP